MNGQELEQKLLTMLDALADGAKVTGASRAAGMYRKFIFACINKSEAGDANYIVSSWRDERSRQFAELVVIAQNMGRVAREQRLRGVTVNGEQQYVLDPALLARFGNDADAKDLAELEGYSDFPFAHDINGNRIPLLSARHPRPQRQHRPHPHTGPNGTFQKPNSPTRPAAGEQSRDASTECRPGAAGMPIRDWRPDDPEPAYSRRVRCAVPPPVVNIPTPASPRVAALREQVAHVVSNPRPLDNTGRPTMPNRIYFIGRDADDDKRERITGREMP